MAMAKSTKRVRVTGMVQGVGFRAWTRDLAARLGVDGWVRNEPDGTVSAVIAGDADRVERMIDGLREGPAGSAVSSVSTDDFSEDVPNGFKIRR